MDYKVSIIVTCYNYAAYLKACLESVWQQSYNNWECIVVDDGSTDGTGVLAKSFVDLDSRFRYVYQQNQGVAVARNTALALITGNYMQFLDGDDLFFLKVIIRNSYLHLSKKKKQHYSHLIGRLYFVERNS